METACWDVAAAEAGAGPVLEADLPGDRGAVGQVTSADRESWLRHKDLQAKKKEVRTGVQKRHHMDTDKFECFSPKGHIPDMRLEISHDYVLL